MHGSAWCWGEARAQQLEIETWPSLGSPGHGIAGYACDSSSLLTPLQMPVVVHRVGLGGGTHLQQAQLTSTVQHPGDCRGGYMAGVEPQLWGRQACLAAATISLSPSRAKMPSSSLPHPPARLNAAPC